jgi:hypothetical protein
MISSDSNIWASKMSVEASNNSRSVFVAGNLDWTTSNVSLILEAKAELMMSLGLPRPHPWVLVGKQAWSHSLSVHG